jgi:hypothetical protein
MLTRLIVKLVRHAAATVLGLALVLISGCAVQPVPLPLPAPVPAPAVAVSPPDLVFVIPRGTASADMRGEPIFTIPSEITVISGQSVVIQNDDQAMHYFAEVPIAPGQTYRKVFGRPGAFGYGGILSCSISERKSVTVTVVNQLPAGVSSPLSGPR